jgi:hypothetical protein
MAWIGKNSHLITKNIHFLFPIYKKVVFLCRTLIPRTDSEGWSSCPEEFCENAHAENGGWAKESLTY